MGDRVEQETRLAATRPRIRSLRGAVDRRAPRSVRRPPRAALPAPNIGPPCHCPRPRTPTGHAAGRATCLRVVAKKASSGSGGSGDGGSSSKGAPPRISYGNDWYAVMRGIVLPLAA